MEKFDCKRNLKHLYAPSSKTISTVEVPPMNFLKIDGHGDPNTSPQYQQAVEALYSVSYKIKFSLKSEGIDFTVSPLEGLWWVADMAKFSAERKEEWEWTMMIMQPEWVNDEAFEKSRDVVVKQKYLPDLPKIRFEPYIEGLAVQIMYYGSYANEGPTVACLHEFIRENGMVTNGKHHEIYLGDPRRTVPEKLKTILRQPVRKSS